MAGDLEDFLKRAAQRRAENEAVRREEQTRQQQAQQRRRPEYTNRDAERRAVFDEYGEDEEEVYVAELVREPNEESVQSWRDRAENRFTSHKEPPQHPPVDQADERLEARLHSTFDHAVGRLDDSPGFAGDRAAENEADRRAAQEILKLLQNPQGVRQALMLREILDRPVDRW